MFIWWRYTFADLFKKPKAKGKFVKEKKVKNKKEGDEAAEEDELLINSDVSVQPLQLVPHLRKFDPAVRRLSFETKVRSLHPFFSRFSNC